jgi:hypothetical protein
MRDDGKPKTSAAHRRTSFQFAVLGAICGNFDLWTLRACGQVKQRTAELGLGGPREVHSRYV